MYIYLTEIGFIFSIAHFLLKRKLFCLLIARTYFPDKYKLCYFYMYKKKTIITNILNSEENSKQIVHNQMTISKVQNTSDEWIQLSYSWRGTGIFLDYSWFYISLTFHLYDSGVILTTMCEQKRQTWNLVLVYKKFSWWGWHPFFFARNVI